MSKWVAAVTLCAAAWAQAQAPSSPEPASGDPKGPGLRNLFVLGASPFSRGDLASTPTTAGILRGYLAESAFRPSSDLALAVFSERFYGLQRYEVSRMGLALEGADAGATLGLLFGALGHTVGLWDERAAWTLMGASAALGGLLGGTVWSDDVRWRVRYRWDEPQEPQYPPDLPED